MGECVQSKQNCFPELHMGREASMLPLRGVLQARTEGKPSTGPAPWRPHLPALTAFVLSCCSESLGSNQTLCGFLLPGWPSSLMFGLPGKAMCQLLASLLPIPGCPVQSTVDLDRVRKKRELLTPLRPLSHRTHELTVF